MLFLETNRNLFPVFRRLLKIRDLNLTKFYKNTEILIKIGVLDLLNFENFGLKRPLIEVNFAIERKNSAIK